MCMQCQLTDCLADLAAACSSHARLAGWQRGSNNKLRGRNKQSKNKPAKQRACATSTASLKLRRGHSTASSATNCCIAALTDCCTCACPPAAACSWARQARAGQGGLVAASMADVGQHLLVLHGRSTPRSETTSTHRPRPPPTPIASPPPPLTHPKTARTPTPTTVPTTVLRCTPGRPPPPACLPCTACPRCA